MPAEIAPADLARRLAASEVIYLLDVREPWEYARASLQNSVLVPLGELPTRHRTLQPPSDALVVTICHHGVRSLDAATFLTMQGWTNVASLAGGIDAWSRLVDPAVPRY
jgi:rhodanese-related sulfurtransferase